MPKKISKNNRERMRELIKQDFAKLDRNRLLRFFGIQNAPGLVLIDAVKKQMITSDGRRGMQDDPEGHKFPWWPPIGDEIFSGSLLSNQNKESGEILDFSNIAGRKKGLLFSANWCPPCRTFVRQLVQTYENIRKSVDQSFEIIFCSSDRSEDSFRQHFSNMPWLAFPFADERIRLITRLYSVQVWPQREFSRANTFDWRFEEELNGNDFPNSTSATTDTSCPQETNRNGQETAVDESYKDPLQFFFTGDDPICDQILDSLGLQDAPLPLICILDVLGEVLYVCEQPDVSEDVLSNFLSEFRAGSLASKKISQTDVGKWCGVAHVGGIPLNAISAALGMSPSQNPMGQSLIIGADKT